MLLMLLLLLSICYGHISMTYPPSRRNQLSEYYANIGLVNYNLRSPLNVSPDFFSFPCKGFPKGPVVATFEKNEITITLEGTATHGGGHCQFGISYDDNNFVVLKTVLNECLLNTMSYSYEIPTYARGDNITVFWTWINRIGNREYYMECTDVNVNNVTKNIYKKYYTPKHFVNLGINKIRNLIKSIGLFNNKAKNIFFLSNQFKKIEKSKNVIT